MKICPTCQQTYNDNSLNYCLIDGAILVPTKTSETAAPSTIDSLTNRKTDQYENILPSAGQPLNANSTLPPPKKSNTLIWVLLILGVVILFCGGGFVGLFVYLSTGKSSAVNYDSTGATNGKKNDSNDDPNSSNLSVKPVDTTDSNSVDATPTGLTMNKYLQLKPEMSYQEAVKILGGEGAELSNSASGNIKIVMYKWDNNDSEFITAMFINNRLNMRSQAGLSKRLSPSLNLEKFNQTKKGMTYQEVAAILGEGDEQGNSTMANIKFATYHWQVDKVSYITLSFVDGKLNSKSQFGLK